MTVSHAPAGTSRSGSAPFVHRARAGLLARALFAAGLVAAAGLAPLPIAGPGIAVAQNAGYAIGQTVYVGNTDGDGLLLRDGPGFDATVLNAFSDGTPVLITDGPIQAADGTFWYAVEVGGQSGYMLSDYLIADGAGSVPSDPTAPPAGTTTAPGNGTSNAGRTGDATTSASPGTVNTTAPTSSGNGPRDVSVNADGPDTTVGPNGEAIPAGNGNRQEEQASAEQFASAEQAAGASAATTDLVNLRAAPSWEAEILRVLPPGSAVEITGQAEGEWTPVWYNGTDGWIVSQYLGATAAWTAQRADRRGARSGLASVIEAADLKAEPSADGAVIGAIPVGATFTPEAGPEQGFYQVTWEGTTGWVSGAFLSFDGSAVGNPGDEAAANAAPATESPATDAPAGEAPAFAGITWPVSSGSWYVLQGYNGSSHVNRDAAWQYAYALDIAREDGDAAGAPVSSPVNGIVRWTDPSSGGLSIDLGNGHALALFHVTLDGALAAGTPLRQGDPIGTVSGPGGMGFSGMAHVHIALWKTADGGNWDRQAAPFVGEFAIAGTEFPDVGGSQQYRGFEFRP